MTDTPSARVAIVTGAARGIGAAVAARLAAAGHAVGIVDLDAETCAEAVEKIRANGGTALAVGADVADEEAVTAAVATVAAELGPPTVLVNNAGVLRDNLLFRMTTADWDTVMGVHLRGAFLTSRAVQGFMVEARYGRIVNMSSISALGNRGQANYSAAKAGLQGLTRTLAMELGRFGITVNAIAPGFIVTDMTRSTADRIGLDFAEFEASLVAGIPVGRAGVPEDVAAAAEYLTGPDAGFVSGQVLYVAGGERT
ncbi:3-oxoacyl-ACP reductase FabG [Pseudonocardia halophobica]|uniref:3-oxoacyl-ACP reductase n=1 Tax=Pseudonocardia halophobica TaxID=29401 RepID=A0A9W6L204_9PSEU|nr:3-oxoacyl-ACP reductase FabG [Pseudonocardia halophobica]GLL12257.1 3-oxoacyl-ACP reductase [Pseudonocardia halophobica]